jgi:ribose transport system ATP-binding protein
MPASLLEVDSLVKEFSGVRVLNQANFSMHAGEILGVIGENGAGKSTLMKIICGIYQPSGGRLLLDGKELHLRQPADAKNLGIVMIPQEFNLVDSLRVFENVFLGNELTKNGVLDKPLMKEKTEAVLRELQTSINPNARLTGLSVAQKQMVEIGKALIHNLRVLIMDEPTTMLNRQEVEILFTIMAQLRDKGVSILFVSHKLKEVKQICDRVLVLRDGEPICLEAAAALTVEEMARRMVGRELSQVFPDKIPGEDRKVLEVRDMEVPGLLSHISFTLHRGEILGFAGLVGAGRTELAEAIVGLRRRSAGVISVCGKEETIERPWHAVQNRIAYLSEDRQGQGIVPNFTIPQNITLVSLKNYGRAFINRRKERTAADSYVSRFNIKAASLMARLQFLSGGNQQKVYLSKWMDIDPQVLILDEPTRGIDVNAKMEIYKFIHGLAERMIAIIVISSELEEIIGLCHRVLVMREGTIATELAGQAITEQEIMYYATGAKEGGGS